MLVTGYASAITTGRPFVLVVGVGTVGPTTVSATNGHRSLAQLPRREVEVVDAVLLGVISKRAAPYSRRVCVRSPR